ncbi:hypothetical protein [Halorussus lipolyticus]|uniref:hypothetical protein n=1 Tax=Halorussus lipolyticus TaxID=3034024 RepID=UPI0023E78053|nr:hypothetical protein [Halorussus sp. DT80]
MGSDTERQEKLEQFRREVEGLENVQGVAYDPKEKRFVALVSKKKPESELPEDQLVANRTSMSEDEHGVVEIGELKAHTLRMAISSDSGEVMDPESSAEFRPVMAGAEEQPDSLPIVGTGSYVARVTDLSKGEWTEGVSEGDVVRVSNWHVYVADGFEANRPIHQPFRGGEVGELVGYAPLEDGSKADAAARTVTKHDGWGTIGLDVARNGDEYGRSVVRDITDEHGGATVTKTGRTTDTTTAEIDLIDVSVNVNYGDDENPNLIRVEDCVLTTALGRNGDSGSAVYLEENGALCGLYFAGSEEAGTGVFAQINNVEAELGIEAITDWEEETKPIEYGRSGDGPSDEVQQFKDDLKAFIENW